MIENEMERFREHEKEFKMKQYSKRALKADKD
jgi:CCR4-NOT transcriptional regulation complex NOT5 subunit